MATSMVDSSDHGCGFLGSLLQLRGLRHKRSSVRSLTANTKNTVTEKKQRSNKSKPVKAVVITENVDSSANKPKPEKSVNDKPVTPKASSILHNHNHTHNQSRRLSDAARNSTTSSSSSSTTVTKSNRFQEKHPFSGDHFDVDHQNTSTTTTPQAVSGNILQLAQMSSLKHNKSCLSLNTNSISPSLKSLEHSNNNVTMGNILRRHSTDERLFHQSSMTNKLDPEELKSLGNDKFKQGKYEEALALYDKAISIDSRVASYRSNKSAAFTALGRLLEAVSESREAVRIEPSYQRAQHRLATLYLRLGYAEDAAQHFNLSGSIASYNDITQVKALQTCLSKCDDAKKHKNWGILLSQTYDALASGANSSLQIYALQSQALLNLHRHDEAYTTLKRAPSFDMDLYAQLFGETKTTYFYLIKAQVYMTTGRFEDAITAAQKAAQLSPSDKEARTMVIRTRSVAVARSKGNKLYQESKLLEACSIYSEGLEFDPYNSVLLCNRAACRSKLCQFEKALEDCTMALNLQPCYSKARLRRAHCNAKMERWEASIQDYEILIREKPGDEEVGRALFEAQVQLKKQRGEDVKDMKFGADVVLVSSIECFRHLITSPGMSVVLFCSKSNQEKALPLLEQVCLRFPSISFLKVEVEDHPYLAKSEVVTNIPAFKIYKNGSRVKDILGNNFDLLHNTVKLYSS